MARGQGGLHRSVLLLIHQHTDRPPCLVEHEEKEEGGCWKPDGAPLLLSTAHQNINGDPAVQMEHGNAFFCQHFIARSPIKSDELRIKKPIMKYEQRKQAKTVKSFPVRITVTH